MKMRNVLSDRQPGEGLTGGAVDDVSGNRSDELQAIRGRRKKNGTAAGSVDGDAINKVRLSPLLPRADVAGEEAQRVGSTSDGRKAEPADLHADVQPVFNWSEWYDLLWEFKRSHWHKNHR